jgi:hypothetical protein
MGWRRFGRAGDAPGVSPSDGERNRRLHFSGLIVFNVLRAGKFSSSIFSGAGRGCGRARRTLAGLMVRVGSDRRIRRAILRCGPFNSGRDNFHGSIVFNALRAEISDFWRVVD